MKYKQTGEDGQKKLWPPPAVLYGMATAKEQVARIRSSVMMNFGRTSMTAPWTRWQDWCNLVLGVILFIAPWFTISWSHMNSSWDAWILGVVIVLISLWALATPGTIVPKVINLILGIWVFISPWILGFAYMAGIAWAAWIIGALVIILSAWALTQMQQSPTRAAV